MLTKIIVQSNTSLSGTHAYWDSNTENYYVNTKDDLNQQYWAYTPAFGATDATQPISIEMDISFENQDWGTYPGVRFYSNTPTGIHEDGNPAIFRIDNAYRNSFVKQIGIYDNGGHSYYTPQVVNGSWYRVRIETNGLGKANLTVTNIDTGDVIYKVTDVDFTIDDFSYMGVGYYGPPDYGDSWSPIRIDNINIRTSNNEISPEISVEAETATIGGAHVVSSENQGFSGSGYIEFQGEGYIEYTFNAEEGVVYDLAVDYALDVGGSHLSVILNGLYGNNSFNFQPTGSLENWKTSGTVELLTIPGLNTVRLQTTGSSGPNIDKLKLAPRKVSVFSTEFVMPNHGIVTIDFPNLPDKFYKLLLIDTEGNSISADGVMSYGDFWCMS